MTIQLDNGTDIEITEKVISITNGFRGFTWDLATNELHKATETVTVEHQDNTARALATKLARVIEIHLEHFSCITNNTDGTCAEFKGLLNDDDFLPPEVNLYKALYPSNS